MKITNPEIITIDDNKGTTPVTKSSNLVALNTLTIAPEAIKGTNIKGKEVDILYTSLDHEKNTSFLDLGYRSFDEFIEELRTVYQSPGNFNFKKENPFSLFSKIKWILGNINADKFDVIVHEFGSSMFHVLKRCKLLIPTNNDFIKSEFYLNISLFKLGKEFSNTSTNIDIVLVIEKESGELPISYIKAIYHKQAHNNVIVCGNLWEMDSFKNIKINQKGFIELYSSAFKLISQLQKKDYFAFSFNYSSLFDSSIGMKDFYEEDL